jgi:hypothetical protein
MNLDAAKSLGTKGWHQLANSLKYETRNLIDGSFTDAKSGVRSQAVNPVNNEILAELPRSGEADVNAVVASARKMFRSEVWTRAAPRDRMDVMFRFTQRRPVGTSLAFDHRSRNAIQDDHTRAGRVHEHGIFPCLLRRLTIDRPNQVRASDAIYGWHHARVIR